MGLNKSKESAIASNHGNVLPHSPHRTSSFWAAGSSFSSPNPQHIAYIWRWVSSNALISAKEGCGWFVPFARVGLAVDANGLCQGVKVAGDMEAKNFFFREKSDGTRCGRLCGWGDGCFTVIYCVSENGIGLYIHIYTPSRQLQRRWYSENEETRQSADVLSDGKRQFA